MNGYTREERWIPVDEFGKRWTPRSREEAEAAMRECPEGSLYSDGAPMGGVVRIIREVRYVTEWTEEPATDPRRG